VEPPEFGLALEPVLETPLVDASLAANDADFIGFIRRQVGVWLARGTQQATAASSALQVIVPWPAASHLFACLALQYKLGDVRVARGKALRVLTALQMEDSGVQALSLQRDVLPKLEVSEVPALLPCSRRTHSIA
jgi:hypothetical protein